MPKTECFELKHPSKRFRRDLMTAIGNMPKADRPPGSVIEILDAALGIGVWEFAPNGEVAIWLSSEGEHKAHMKSD